MTMGRRGLFLAMCTQHPPGGSNVARYQLIDFGVVRNEEQCP